MLYVYGIVFVYGLFKARVQDIPAPQYFVDYVS